jgi:TolB-like protein/Tfp pilus assembly protein PilF
MDASARLTFGPFALDPERRLLLAGGQSAPLTVRGAVLLQVLLEAGGDTVSKSALMERAWPGLAVEEGNLAVQVATLRKTLAALAPGGPDWIHTVPRVGYRLLNPVAAAAPAGAGRATLAVLPFDNLSAEPGQDYFADGIVEELTTALSRFRTFAVLSRSSAFAWRGRKSDHAAMLRELGVGYVLDGSVRRAGTRLRVTTQLIDTATGLQLWAERFDGDLADVFDVQDTIAEAVIGHVEPQLRKAEIARARRKRPDSLSAYDLYLSALPHLCSPTPAAWGTALELLTSAIALDLGFAPALAAAAWTHEKRIRQFMPPLTADDTAEALELARRAIAADPEDATVLAAGGWVPIAIAGEFDPNLALVRRAMAMNPNNIVVLNFAGAANIFAGDLDEAESSYLRAYALSPGAPDAYWSLTGLGQVHLLTGEFDEAVAWCERSLALNDHFPTTVGTCAAALALAGRMDAARAMMARLLSVKPHVTLSGMRRRYVRDRLRWRNTIEGLRLAGLPEDDAPADLAGAVF